MTNSVETKVDKDEIEQPMVVCKKLSLEDIALARTVDNYLNSRKDPGLSFFQHLAYRKAARHIRKCDTCDRNYELMNPGYRPRGYIPTNMKSRLFPTPLLVPRYG